MQDFWQKKSNDFENYNLCLCEYFFSCKHWLFSHCEECSMGSTTNIVSNYVFAKNNKQFID